jgi:hypothetical protein
MKTAALLVLFLVSAVGAEAQVPHIVGTWTLNVAASRLPGPPPRTHVRKYSLGPDGTLVGLAVIVDANGNPDFLTFAARSDGKDYPEFNSQFLARWVVQGTKTSREYTETPVDERTVDWADKFDGRVVASGRKWISPDGRTLSFTADSKDAQGQAVTFLYVFDRQ